MSAEIFRLMGTISINRDESIQQITEVEQRARTASTAMESSFGRIAQSAERISRRLSTLGTTLNTVGRSLTRNLSVPVAAAVGAMTALAITTANYADELDKTSMSLGVNTDELQELRYAASQLGVEQSALDRSLGRLNQRLGMAVQGNQSYQQSLERLGVDMEALRQGTVTTDDAFTTIITTLAQVDDSQRQAALASDVFGTQVSRRLLPMIRAGNVEIEELREQAHALGIVMSEDGIAAGVQFSDAMDRLRRQFAAVWREVGERLLPIFLERLLPMMENQLIPSMRVLTGLLIGFVDWVSELHPLLIAMGVALVGVAVAGPPILIFLSSLIKASAVVIGAITALVKAKAAWAAVLFSLKTFGASLLLLLPALIDGIIDFGKGFMDATFSVEELEQSIRDMQGVAEDFQGFYGDTLGEMERDTTDFYVALARLRGDEVTAFELQLEQQLAGYREYVHNVEDVAEFEQLRRIELIRGLEAEHLDSLRAQLAQERHTLETTGQGWTNEYRAILELIEATTERRIALVRGATEDELSILRRQTLQEAEQLDQRTAGFRQQQEQLVTILDAINAERLSMLDQMTAEEIIALRARMIEEERLLVDNHNLALRLHVDFFRMNRTLEQAIADARERQWVQEQEMWGDIARTREDQFRLFTSQIDEQADKWRERGIAAVEVERWAQEQIRQFWQEQHQDRLDSYEDMNDQQLSVLERRVRQEIRQMESVFETNRTGWAEAGATRAQIEQAMQEEHWQARMAELELEQEVLDRILALRHGFAEQRAALEHRATQMVVDAIGTQEERDALYWERRRERLMETFDDLALAERVLAAEREAVHREEQAERRSRELETQRILEQALLETTEVFVQEQARRTAELLDQGWTRDEIDARLKAEQRLRERELTDEIITQVQRAEERRARSAEEGFAFRAEQIAAQVEAWRAAGADEVEIDRWRTQQLAILEEERTAHIQEQQARRTAQARQLADAELEVRRRLHRNIFQEEMEHIFARVQQEEEGTAERMQALAAYHDFATSNLERLTGAELDILDQQLQAQLATLDRSVEAERRMASVLISLRGRVIEQRTHMELTAEQSLANAIFDLRKQLEDDIFIETQDRIWESVAQEQAGTAERISAFTDYVAFVRRNMTDLTTEEKRQLQARLQAQFATLDQTEAGYEQLATAILRLNQEIENSHETLFTRLADSVSRAVQNIEDSIANGIDNMVRNWLLGTNEMGEHVSGFRRVATESFMIIFGVLSAELAGSIMDMGRWASEAIAAVIPTIVAFLATAYAALVGFFWFLGPMAPAAAAGVIGVASAAIAALIGRGIGAIIGAVTGGGRPPEEEEREHRVGTAVQNVTGPTRDLFMDLLTPLAQIPALIGIQERMYHLLDQRLPYFGEFAPIGQREAVGGVQVNIDQILVTGLADTEIGENIIDQIEEALADRVDWRRRGVALNG